MRVDNTSTGKGTSGMDKFCSKIHRVHMELGGKLLNSLRIKTQFLERLQSVSVVDGAAHTLKDDVESNGGSLENVANVFVLFVCGVQLVLRSGVLTVLDLDEVDVTPRFAEVFGSMLSGVGGSAGGWRCCWGAPSLPQLPPATGVAQDIKQHSSLASSVYTSCVTFLFPFLLLLKWEQSAQHLGS